MVVMVEAGLLRGSATQQVAVAVCWLLVWLTHDYGHSSWAAVLVAWSGVRANGVCQQSRVYTTWRSCWEGRRGSTHGPEVRAGWTSLRVATLGQLVGWSPHWRRGWSAWRRPAVGCGYVVCWSAGGANALPAL